MKRIALVVSLSLSLNALAETQKEIEKAFKAKLTQVDECINILASKNKVVRASDVMKVTVDKNGIVKDFVYRSKDPDFLEYGQCLKKNVMGSQLPKPNSGKAITFASRISWKSPEDIQLNAGPQKEVADQIEASRDCSPEGPRFFRLDPNGLTLETRH